MISIYDDHCWSMINLIITITIIIFLLFITIMVFFIIIIMIMKLIVFSIMRIMIILIYLLLLSLGLYLSNPLFSSPFCLFKIVNTVIYWSDHVCLYFRCIQLGIGTNMVGWRCCSFFCVLLHYFHPFSPLSTSALYWLI